MDSVQFIRDRIKDAFGELEFEEKYHNYTLNGKRLPSVSKMNKTFYVPFDKKIAKYSAGKGKYLDMNEEQVVNMWEENRESSALFGTKVHTFAENYIQGIHKKIENNCELGIVQWWMDLPEHYVPVCLELRMFSKKYGFAGTADLILLNKKTGNLIIGDYKTNGDLFKSYGKKMLSPFKKYTDNSFNKYQLQFSHYQICLEEAGFTVEDRLLIWTTEDKDNMKFYKQFKTQDFTKELKKYYETHK
jgi:hypothetical protein